MRGATGRGAASRSRSKIRLTRLTRLTRLCVPKTSSVLIARPNRLNVSGDDRALLAPPGPVRLTVQVKERTCGRERCAPTSIDCTAAEGARSRSTHEWGSLVLGQAISMVSIGPHGHYDRPSRDSRTVLAVEIPLSWRPTEDRWGTARADPPDERRKSAMGCAAHSWRAAQARLRGRSVQRGEVMVKRCGPPSQGWSTFLRNHAPHIAAMDLFVTPTIGFGDPVSSNSPCSLFD